MTDLVRQEIASVSERVVVKVGTRVLTGADGQLNTQRISQLAEEISAIREQGLEVVLVSSGAVGAGMSLLQMTNRPTSLPQLQAVAAIGQAHLIELYDQHFRQHGFHAAQVLLTADDVGRPPEIPQRPQHFIGLARTRCHPGDQRERHRSRG